MNLLQINVSVNTGSTGRIAEDIGKAAIASNYDSYIAYGRKAIGSISKLIKIESDFGIFFHGLKSRLFDKQGLGSVLATKKFIKKIEIIKPDIIHIHNLHGYYINYEILFEYLNKLNIPVIWTFHDCWPITGHCSYFDAVNCNKWQTECNDCLNQRGYPKSLFIDNSKTNFHKKKSLFSFCKNLIIVTPSVWLTNIVKHSFLSEKKIFTINNGIDMNVFQPIQSNSILKKYNIPSDKFVILGVANIWNKRKGYDDFIELSKCIGNNYSIVLVGLNKKQQRNLPDNMIGISKTENIEELAQLYSAADVFVNPTWVDNFPTTNIEALACGTPVITYKTGGSPEAVSPETGFVVEKGNLTELLKSIQVIKEKGKSFYTTHCMERAKKLYNKEDKYAEYIKLYNELITR
jgi:glycosyltransferase involved in cell wall biosynthesis